MTRGGTLQQDQAIAELRRGLRGALLRPGDAGYDEIRASIRAHGDTLPALIARCTGMADVRLALTFARRHGLPVHVRGGSLSVEGGIISDTCLVIDLSPIRTFSTDPARRTVHVASGSAE